MDKVLLTGVIFTARDMAHKRLCAMIEHGEPLPIELSESVIYYCGPSPTPPGKICGAIGPTTSQRMDKYTPLLIQNGLRVMIGKGERNDMVLDSIHQNRAVYLVTIGGAAALLSRHVLACELFYWEDLGAEAIYRLEVKDLPCYVAAL